MEQKSEKRPPFDQFNMEVPQDHFPDQGMAARAAHAMTSIEALDRCRRYTEPVAARTAYAEPKCFFGSWPTITLKDYIDRGMYPSTFRHGAPRGRWLRALWDGPWTLPTSWCFL
jgi:glutamate decarboxylase